MWRMPAGGVVLLLNSKDIQDFLNVHISSAGNFTVEWYNTTGRSNHSSSVLW
jgi:hypothetical protein